MSRPPQSPSGPSASTSPATDQAAPGESVANPRIVRKQSRISWIWIVPIVAALAGAVLVYRHWADTGPRITLTFETASGLQTGQTQIRYKDVTVGLVTGIRLSEDWDRVEVTADINRDAADLAREGTRFWVVRPRLALSGVSGLGTLLSGAYIEADTPGDEPGAERPVQREFTGLEVPPEITYDRPGRRFTLETADLGSLGIGSPVYLRRLNVGRIVGYELDAQARNVKVNIFVDAPYDRYVTAGTHFWNASGVDVDVSAQGVRLRTESVVSLLLGGIAFEPTSAPDSPAAADAVFALYPNRAAAQATPDGAPLPVRLHFEQSVRGLSVGAPIDFRGLTLGSVTAITMEFDEQRTRFYTVVDANLYPMRMGPVYQRILDAVGPRADAASVLGPMVERGLRAQLRTANLLTGQLYVGLETYPDAQPVESAGGAPFVIPTIPGEFDQLQQQLVNIVNKIEQLPLDDIAGDLRTTLTNTARLIANLDTQVTPQARAVLRQAESTLADVSSLISEDASLPLNVDRTLQELARAARSLRVLADYLQANPTALIRGRGENVGPSSWQQR